MKNLILLLTVVLFATVTSCTKDEDIPAAKIGEFKGIDNETIVSVGDKLSFSVTIENTNSTTFQWVLDGKEIIGNESTLEFTPQQAGRHTIKVIVETKGGTDEREITFDVITAVAQNGSKWISEILEYRPAPGQFMNVSPGNMASAEGIVGKKGMVTLGAFGGSIIFRFDHTVLNKEGVDFVIHGNAFTGSSEPGAVMVSYDANGNGKADDEWFELKGSEYDKSIKNYQITYTKPNQTETAENVLWTDNQGANGQVSANSFHKQCYFPLFLEGNPSVLQYTGNRVPNNATVNEGGIWYVGELESGYVDNYSKDYPEQIGTDPDTKNSNKFDISTAVDAKGNKIPLKAIDFIKVYNCINQEAGWLGEISTEVCGAISLTAVK